VMFRSMTMLCPLCAALTRKVDKEQEEEERKMLQKSWEMATILDFLELFRPYLNLSRSFTVHELESVLILSPGGEGLLGTLHIVSPGLMSSSMLSAFWPSPSLEHPSGALQNVLHTAFALQRAQTAGRLANLVPAVPLPLPCQCSTRIMHACDQSLLKSRPLNKAACAQASVMKFI